MEMLFTALHTAEAEEVILMTMVALETLEAWDKEWAIKTAEAQAEAEEQEEIGSGVQQVAVADLLAQDKMVRIQHRQTELEVLDILEDLDLAQEHQVAEQDQTTAGLHGLVLEEQAVTDNMDLQAEAAEAEEQAEADLAEVELEDHRQLITLVDSVETEQDQVAVEITISQE
jgi:hypothetical protein